MKSPLASLHLSRTCRPIHLHDATSIVPLSRRLPLSRQSALCSSGPTPARHYRPTLALQEENTPEKLTEGVQKSPVNAPQKVPAAKLEKVS